MYIYMCVCVCLSVYSSLCVLCMCVCACDRYQIKVLATSMSYVSILSELNTLLHKTHSKVIRY